MTDQDELKVAFPGHTARIHTCNFCSEKKISEIERINKYAEFSVKYSAPKVIEGAENGCLFFQHVLVAHGHLDAGLQHLHEPRHSAANLRNLPKFQDLELEVKFMRWNWDRAEISTSSAWVRKSIGVPSLPEVDYTPLAYEDDPAHELVPIRPFLKRVEVDTIAQCREFVRICDFSHSACHSQNLSFLPTRLLRIDTSEDEGSTRVRLCLTATLSQVHYEKMEYSTLSYCWGGQQEFRLNAESEDLLLSGVSASHLPRTLFDAVQVSRHLGIPFIWIDSLCIRQDDRKEMASEVASMHLVYSNSAVTISAAKATHCEEGFLSPCSFPLPESLGYKLPISTPSGDIGSIVLCPKSVGEPIDQRGWTLQEHLLARRVLRFTNWGVHWSCGSIFHAENTDTLPREIINQAESTAETSRGLKSLSGTEDRSCKTWMGIVMDYSRRISSDSLDMLPAMSAIAETWARGAKDQYLAGLWRSHLPLALLWTVRGSRTIGSYIAPSWSWATAVGEILWASEIATQIDSDLRFEECTTILTSPQAPLGAIQSGRLVVYGRIQRTNTEFDRFKQHTPQSGLLDIASASKILDHNFSDIDTLHHFENTEWYCLQLCIFEENTETGPCGLILATKDGEVFERVGMFWFDDYKPRVDFANRRSAFQNIAPRRITII